MWSRNTTFSRAQGFDAMRDPQNAERLLVHVHIPKTAGTSLNKALESHFPVGDSFAQRTPGELLAMPIARLASARFISGHFGFSMVDMLRFRDPFVVTMSRDPLEQVPSAWRFLRREGRIPQDLSLERWIVDEEFGPGPNSQTRAFVRLFQTTGFTESPIRGWLFHRNETTEELAAALEQRMGEVHLAAPSERVADLYRRIVRDLDLPGAPVTDFPRLNTTERSPISDEARELIESTTPLDRRFHELCTARWESST